MPSPEKTTTSPLAAIRDQERTLSQQIRTAEERSNKTLADARARSDALKQQAESEGVREAESLYQAGLARAREEATVITRDGEKRAVQQQETGMKRIAKAVDHIVAFVLPRSKD
jgi:vacuolar-type H+-ATPase subunit H